MGSKKDDNRPQKLCSGRSVMFIIKNLILALLKKSNLTTLFWRIYTVLIVAYYYIQVEQIDYDSWVPNQESFVFMVLFWHYMAVNFKVF